MPDVSKGSTIHTPLKLVTRFLGDLPLSYILPVLTAGLLALPAGKEAA
jgi:hypothetical protein